MKNNRIKAIGTTLLILFSMSIGNILTKMSFSTVSPYTFVYMTVLIGMLSPHHLYLCHPPRKDFFQSHLKKELVAHLPNWLFQLCHRTSWCACLCLSSCHHQNLHFQLCWLSNYGDELHHSQRIAHFLSNSRRHHCLFRAARVFQYPATRRGMDWDFDGHW